MNNKSFRLIPSLALMGVGTSALISLGFSIATQNFLPAPLSAIDQMGVIMAVVMNYLAGAIMFIGGYWIQQIYKVNKWSLKKRTALHFIGTCVLFFICSQLAHWIVIDSIQAVIASIVIFILIYTVIWLGFYFDHKAQAKALNQKLNDINN